MQKKIIITVNTCYLSQWIVFLFCNRYVKEMELFQRLVNSPSKKQQRQKQQQFSRWTRCTSSCLCFSRRHSRTSITDTVELPNTWPQCRQPSFVSLLLSLLLPLLLLLLLSATRSYSVTPNTLTNNIQNNATLTSTIRTTTTTTTTRIMTILITLKK